MTEKYYYPAPRFEGIDEYVKNGVPEGNWLYDTTDDFDERKKLWYDTNSYVNDYAGYPASVLYSARFRDGMVGDEEVYPEFNSEFGGFGKSADRICWNEKFVDLCQVEYNYLLEKGGVNIAESNCTDGNHNTVQGIKTTSGHAGAVCISAKYRSNFLEFCLGRIEGYQSQKLMREKFFILLEEEAQHLPKHHNKHHRDPQYQNKWMHSLQAVLTLFVAGAEPWLTFKLYGSWDLDYLFEDFLPQVKQTMSHLKNNKVFDSQKGSEILVYLLSCMRQVEATYSQISDYMEDESRESLFSPLLKSYTALAQKYYTKYHENDFQPLELMPAWEEKEDEDDEDDEEMKEA